MRALLVFALGIFVGAVGLKYYYKEYGYPPTREVVVTQRPPDPAAPPVPVTPPPKPTLLDKARDSAEATRGAISRKLSEWNLGGDSIKEDLAKTGQVVRTKAKQAGSSIATATSNARIVTVIKAKYTLDEELAARTINIDCADGKVTLRGNVASHDLVGKAVALALETDGVAEVTSLLTVQS